MSHARAVLSRIICALLPSARARGFWRIGRCAPHRAPAKRSLACALGRADLAAARTPACERPGRFRALRRHRAAGALRGRTDVVRCTVAGPLRLRQPAPSLGSLPAHCTVRRALALRAHTAAPLRVMLRRCRSPALAADARPHRRHSSCGGSPCGERRCKPWRRWLERSARLWS